MPRFMMFMVPGELPEGDWEPDAEIVAVMNRYNEELTKAGALLALDGLRPPQEAVNITADADGKRTVTDGPFTEAKEMVGGYWIIQAKDMDEAIEWAKRVPLGPGPRVELREIFEITDMSADVQEAGKLSQEPPQQTVASE